MATEPVEEVGDGLARREFGRSSGGDAIRSPLAEYEFHDWLSPAGERDGGGEVVGITTAPDEGGVSDTAGSLVESAAGGGGGGEIAVEIEGDGTDGIVGIRGIELFMVAIRRLSEFGSSLGRFVVRRMVSGEGFVGQAGRLSGLRVGKPFAFTFQNELTIRDEGHAMRGCEGLRSLSNDVDMGTLFKNEASGLNGISQVFDAGDTAGLHAASIHQEGVELHATIGGKEATAACVEGGIIFEYCDGGLDGIKGRTVLSQDVEASAESAADSVEMSRCVGGGNGPSSTVNQQRRNWRGP